MMRPELAQSNGGLYTANERVRVPAQVHPYSTGPIGGIIAGAVMTVAMAGWGAVTGYGIWMPVNLIAATFIPELQIASVETLANFHLMGAVVGTLLHFGFSILLVSIFAAILPTLPGSAFFWALVVGPGLWFSAQYLALPIFNPRMETRINLPSFAISHLMYSLVLGWWIARTPKI